MFNEEYFDFDIDNYAYYQALILHSIQ